MRVKSCRLHARLTAGAVALAALCAAVAGWQAPASGDSDTPAPCSPTSAVSCELAIPYIDDGDPAHTLDAYWPTNLTDRASIVIIHGGRWLTGNSLLFQREAVYFAENGFAAFSINYTLSRRHQPAWPQIRTDVEAATAWVMANARQYHGNGSEVGVLGGSAGATLAALVDTDGPSAGVSPQAAVSWSGDMDMKIAYNRGNGAAKNAIYMLLGCRPHTCPQTYGDASPVTHVASGDGSVLLLHSADERVPVAGDREMNQALAAAGVPHKLVVLKHSTLHAREYECALVRLDGERLTVIDDSLRWLGSQLDQPTVPTGTFCSLPTESAR